jgi:hypothetical protein
MAKRTPDVEVLASIVSGVASGQLSPREVRMLTGMSRARPRPAPRWSAARRAWVTKDGRGHA